MADLVFNISKGKMAEYAARVNANDPTNAVLVIVPVDVAAVTDATIRDLDTLALVLAAGVTERSTSNWNRKTLDQSAGITITVDDANDRVDVDIPDQTWTTAGGASNNTLAKMVVYYQESAADSGRVPLTAHDFVVTTDGSDLTAQIASAGFFRAS